MSITLEIKPEEGFIRVRVSGQFSLQEVNEAFVKMLEAISLHSATNVLVDCRSLQGTPTTMERFDHSVFAAQKLSELRTGGTSRGMRFAYVCEVPLLDPEKFGETVGLNRAVKVSVNDSIEDALRWLEIDPADKAVDCDKK